MFAVVLAAPVSTSLLVRGLFCIGHIILCYFKFCLWTLPFSLSFPCSLKILVQERKLKALPFFRFNCKWGKRGRGKEIETSLPYVFSFYFQSHLTCLTQHFNLIQPAVTLWILDLSCLISQSFFNAACFSFLDIFTHLNFSLKLFAWFIVSINFQKPPPPSGSLETESFQSLLHSGAVALGEAWWGTAAGLGSPGFCVWHSHTWRHLLFPPTLGSCLLCRAYTWDLSVVRVLLLLWDG